MTSKGTISGAVEVKGGSIVSMVERKDWYGKVRRDHVVDYRDAVVIPGLVDVHTQFNEPGRTE